ncbi:MAG TPA: hypothetical protein VF048_04265 [Gemmatimonadaceae bacterium]
MSRRAYPPPSSPPPPPGRADAPPADVEVTISVHADGRQIAVRRCVAADAGAPRTVHIDAVVRG